MFFALLSLVASITKSQTVKFHLNECMADLILLDYHNFTGQMIQAPPQTIEQDSSVILFEYDYARKEEFGSMLNMNINYVPKGVPNSPTTTFHTFLNVNVSGGVYISTSFSAGQPQFYNATGCTNVENNGGTLPSTIGLYVWFKKNQTETECKAATTAIDDCKFLVIIDDK